MVKEDTIRGMYAIGFTIVNRDPVCIELSDPVRAPWVEGGRLALGGLRDLSIEL